jgi:hypothetical protein
MKKVNLSEKFALINEHWRPKVVGELSGQEAKPVKFAGAFHRQSHAQFTALVGDRI